MFGRLLFSSLIACPLAACATDTTTAPSQQTVGGKADGASAVVDTHFEVDCVPTSFGQNVYLVGDSTELGKWDPQHAVPLSGMFDPDTGNFVFSWEGVISLPRNKGVHFKFITVDQNGYVTWESSANRTFTPGGVDDVSQSYLGMVLESANYSNYAAMWSNESGNACPWAYWTYEQRVNGQQQGNGA